MVRLVIYLALFKHMTNRTQLGIGLSVIIILLLIGVYAYDRNSDTFSPVPTQSNTDTTVDTTTPNTTNDGSSAAGGTVPSGLTQGEQCKNMGGTWSEQYKECTGIQEVGCTEIGGRWNECASPCRNDPNAEVCIMMCVQVCSLQ